MPRATPHLILALGLSAACATAPAPVPDTPEPALPPGVAGKYDRLGSDHAAAEGAVQPAGKGGVTRAEIIRLREDVPVFRLWSGPERTDARGFTNRLGQWWTFDPPRGTRAAYRQTYAVCRRWNELSWVVRCTLKKGAVVAVGPGNSVDEASCGVPGESYPANERDWQVWIKEAWARTGAGGDLECPESGDHPVSCSDLARPSPDGEACPAE